LALIYLSNGDHAGAKKIQREGYGLIQDYDKYDGSYLLDGKLPNLIFPSQYCKVKRVSKRCKGNFYNS